MKLLFAHIKVQYNVAPGPSAELSVQLISSKAFNSELVKKKNTPPWYFTELSIAFIFVNLFLSAISLNEKPAATLAELLIKLISLKTESEISPLTKIAPPELLAELFIKLFFLKEI